MAKHTASDSDEPKPKPSLKSLKRSLRLYKYIKPYRGAFVLGMVFLFLSSAANLAFPKFLGELVSASTQPDFLKQLGRIALLLAGLLVVQAVFSYFRILLFVRVAEKGLAALRQATYSKMLRLPMAFFDHKRVGELTSRIASDINVLQDVFTSTLAEFIRQLIIIVGGIGLLLYTSPRLTLIMLASLPPVVLLSVAFGRFIRRYAKDVSKMMAEATTVVEETLQGMASVKSYANEHFELGRYTSRTNEVAKTAIRGGVFRAGFASFVILGLFGAVVLVIWQGSLDIARGAMDAGDLFSFVLYSSFIGGSIGGMADVYARLQRASGATEELLDIFDQPEEPIRLEPPGARDRSLKGAVVFEEVRFAYPSRPEFEVIQGLDVAIEPGTRVALVGSSGAGKTTLMALLLRFYTPISGRIRIDGRDLNNWDLSGFRAQVALVPQEVLLFGGSILENIRYGKPGASEAEVVEAAKRAYAHDFIVAFPEGYETTVGERGIQLSGGQRQRIAIARALLNDPALLLLDEATSALDSESEYYVQSALEALMKDRTSLVIAHRLSTIRNADRILVLDHGQIVEDGAPDALLSRPESRFKALWERQLANE
ncbi:ATP-binding cassette domain-containing protein [bacterium]|nr:ATP-binding cassette domain-containing protein [bacterium]